MVEVPGAVLAPVGEAGAVRLELAGYESAAALAAIALPRRVVHVAVPPRGEVRVAARGLGERTLEAVNLEVRPGGPGNAPEERAAPGSVAPARLLDVSWMRNQRVARIAIEPAAHDPGAGRVTLWSRVDVEVTMEPAGAVTDPAEPEDRFESVYRELLVNYDQGRRWRRPAARSATPGLRAAGAPEAVAEVSPRSLFVGRNWIKIAIPSTGFYKVNFGQLRNLSPFSGNTSIPIDSLRLYTWPGLPVLSEVAFCDSCDYREVAFGAVDDDGILNQNEDRIEFFALGPSDWTDLYDPAQPDTVFLNNPYETRSYYYLTMSTADDPLPGPRRRIEPEIAAPTGGGVTPATFTSRVHREQDVVAEFRADLEPPRDLQYWQKEIWFWKSLSAGGSFNADVDAPGYESGQPARLRARFWGIDADFCGPYGSNHVVDLAVNGAGLGRYTWRSDLSAFRAQTLGGTLSSLQPGSNTVTFQVASIPGCPAREDRVALGWFELYYARRFEPVNDELAFDTPAGGGDYRLDIGPFVRADDRPRVFDVTDPYAPREMVQFDYAPGTGGQRLIFQSPQTERRRFRIVRDSSIVLLPSASVFQARPTSLTDLRDTTLSVDYLVIHYDDFAAAADSLARWREARDTLRTMTVPISALYDQFSGGRIDPTAIRTFLRIAYLNWRPAPTYVTFLGGASYDFKNYLGFALPGQPGTLLPTYENNYDYLNDQPYPTDDWILNVDNPIVTVPDFLGGRIPVKDAATALAVVRNKVLLYERAAPFGEYRNRVLFVADDQEQAERYDILGWAHLAQTAKLDSLATPPHIDREYVYLHTYPDPDELGSTKPEAAAAIEAGLEEKGAAILNYIGHGSPFQVSDERVLTATDVGTLDNPGQLPLFIAASCDIGRYNDPYAQSLGELLLLRREGGVMGVISATGDVFSNQNAYLNESLYVHVFRRDAGGRYRTPLSAALITAKLAGSENSQKYQLLGDAAARLNLPDLWVALTAYDSSGTTPLTTIQQGQTVFVKGVVQDPAGLATVSDFSGVAAILIEDATPLEKAPTCRLPCRVNDPTPCPCPCGSPYLPLDCRPEYYYRAGPVYRGDLAIAGGQFSGRFVVPLEARLGPRGRLRAYVTGARGSPLSTTDGVGTQRIPVAAGLADANDREGPRITLSFAGGATSVRPDATLRIFLHDPSGILITGHTLQNGIVVTVDESSTERRDVTASFRYAADSYQSGTATYRLENLSPGPHRIRVSAADNLAAGLSAGSHRSSTTIEFEVAEVPELRITGAYLLPNPIRSGGAGSGGQFVVDAPGDSVNVLLRIYTVSGRLIRELRTPGGIGQVQLPWDGRDAEGEALANGVYLFKVHVRGRETDGSSSAEQKADAEGRIVVVNR